MTPGPMLEVEALRHPPGLGDISLSVARGAWVAVVGPGGADLMRLIGGFEAPQAGRISIAGRAMGRLPPERRPTALVVPRLALFPHMTVGDNIAFPLALRRLGTAGQVARVSEVMRLVRLDPDTTHRHPRHLAPDQAVRAALARALAVPPDLMLLDDPLSGLEAPARAALAADLKRLHRQLHLTTLLATRDLGLAMALADRVCVLCCGRVVQEGTPDQVYRRPADAGVARLAAPTNLIAVTVTGGDPTGLRLSAPELGEGLLPLDRAALAVRPGAALLMVRPERVAIGDADGPGLAARIVEGFPRGGRVLWQAQTPLGTDILVETPGDSALQIGQQVTLTWQATDAWLLPPG